MRIKLLVITLFLVALATNSCVSHYQVGKVSQTRILVDKRYDTSVDAAALTSIESFKATVDRDMSPVVGRTARYMAADRPENLLSNLLPDILMWAAPRYNEKPDFAVYNIGGMRAALAKGEITFGDIVDVAPFENKICFLTLPGDKVLELFAQIAHRGGEGVSHGVQITITKDGKLVAAKVNGNAIDKEDNYRIATIDYVAQGNDEMTAFKAGTEMQQPLSSDNNIRNIIADYFRDKSAKGEAVDMQIEGRVVVE